MAFRITGLPLAPFTQYFAMNAADLAKLGARRVTADADRGFPCRISLEDARAGESLILLNHVSHDVENPYRTAYAIYVREQAREPEPWIDCLPPVFAGRTLSLRGFDAEGNLRDARLAMPGEVDDGFGRCSIIRRWPAFTRTTRPTVASRRASTVTGKGRDGGNHDT